jgi:hypothetical protein
MSQEPITTSPADYTDLPSSGTEDWGGLAQDCDTQNDQVPSKKEVAIFGILCSGKALRNPLAKGD